jgi:amino acid adenylation domain-containing protein
VEPSPEPNARAKQTGPPVRGELGSLVDLWQGPSVNYPRNIGLHQLVEAQVERTPDAEAVRFRDRSLTYRELNARANQLANYLLKRGVGRDVLVAVCAERSIEMVVALLASLKAGGAYLPLDPEFPAERLRAILEDANPPVVLTQSHLLDSVPTTAADRLCLDANWEKVAGESTSNPGVEVDGKDIAYAIYTSGSTGKPKGVLNVHEGIINRLLWMQDEFLLEPGDRVLQKTPYSFDISVWEFFWPLLSGAVLVVSEPGGHRDPDYLIRLIREEQISVVHFVPSMLRLFLEAPGVEQCVSLRKVFAAGEALTYDLQQRFFERFHAPLVNLYGPTEAAVDVTFFACQRNSTSKIIPIGRPIANTCVVILDEDRKPVPIGVTGELNIGGVNLARGYLNRPELTAEKFLPNSIPELDTDRLYRTGDLARFMPDGNVEFLGRIDHQIKIRGYRVELGEIEAALKDQSEIAQAVVIAREDRPGDQRLAAYLVATNGAAPESAELRKRLKTRLPDYMLPSSYTYLEELPLTRNGKFDRAALPVPAETSAAQPENSDPARNPVEETLVSIWAEALGLPHIGIHDNFFDLGGHSITAIRALSGINHGFEINLSLRDFFAAPTIAQMAELIAQRNPRPTPAPAAGLVPPGPVEPGSQPADDDLDLLQASRESCVHQLFELQVARRPDAVAIVHRDRRISYAELNQLANGIARELLQRNLGPDALVGLCLDRSPEMIAAMLGVFKAGAAYLPLDPAYPQEHLSLLLKDSGAQALITETSLITRLSQWTGEILIVDNIPGHDENVRAAMTSPHSLAYVMYTSGSTGTPKGVEICHRGITRLVFGNDYARFGPDRVFMQMAPFSFDASTFEIWGALLHGGSSVLYPESLPIASTLGAILKSEHVTTLWLTASLFNALIDDHPAVLQSVEELITGGEALSVPHVARALELLPHTQLINGYGPTETTTFACCYRIPRNQDRLPNSIPIGRPIARTEACILDEHMVAVPPGEPGELYLGGDGLARGYRNRPELTEARFVANPFRADGSRLYRTGDRARLLSDGNIEFLGRNDDQVKIRGFRIELAEVEAVLMRHPSVAQAAACVFEREPGDKHLGGYVVLRSRQHAESADLKKFLSDRVPAFLVPSWLQVLSRLPVTANGKLDRGALPLPEGASLRTSIGVPAPQAQQLHQVSFFQETLLLQDRLYAGTTAYNICRAVELRGHLDTKAMAEALNAIVGRHAALRTTFVSTGSVPLQKIPANWPSAFRELDLTLQQDRYDSVLREEAGTPFDLASDLMLRALLIRLADERHVLVLTVHHIAFDGWSLGILFKELSHFYRAFAQGVAPDLPALPMQYADFAESEHKRLRSGAMDADLEYWRCQLAGAEPLRLPFDHPSAAQTELSGSIFATHLDNRLVLQLEQFARQENSTLFMVMLAAFQALLHRSTGQQDILVAVPVANRPQPEVDGLIGLFLKTVLARARVQPSSSFRQLLAQVRDVMFEGLARQEVPEDRLVEILQPPGTPYMGAPIQALFVMQNAPEEDPCLPGLEVRITSPHNETAKFNLTASVERRDGELFIDAEYNSDLFEAGTVRRLMASYVALLNAVSENPVLALSSLSLPDLPIMLVPAAEPVTGLAPEPALASARAKNPSTLSASDGPSDDPILARLRVMWRDLLGLRSIRNDDNFFELGGHSLLAARMIGQVEKAFGIKLNLNSLFHAPTLIQLAAFIGNGAAQANQVVVPIQPEGLHSPFLCLGSGPMYVKLARLLGSEQPFLGVPRPDPAALCEPFTLEQFATLQVEAIRKIQPSGPYCLGGWSASAVAAYEAARQLRAWGEEVALLVLFDGVNPAAQEGHSRVERLQDRILSTAARVRYHASNFVAGGVRNFLPYLRDRLTWQKYMFTMRVWSFLYRVHQRLGRPIPSWMRDPATILVHCFYRYQPAPYAGRTLLFRHASRPKRDDDDPFLGWGELCIGEFEVCDVPGNHKDIFIEPNVQVMAEKLSNSLKDVHQETCLKV